MQIACDDIQQSMTDVIMHIEKFLTHFTIQCLYISQPPPSPSSPVFVTYKIGKHSKHSRSPTTYTHAVTPYFSNSGLIFSTISAIGLFDEADNTVENGH